MKLIFRIVLASALTSLGAIQLKAETEEHAGHNEERLAISADSLREYGVQQTTAEPRRLVFTVSLNGRFLADEDRTTHVIPRFPGMLREVRKRLGDSVKKGDVLAIIESNQSLHPYEITAPFDGLVIRRHGSTGEYVAENRDVFVLADLSQLCADLFVFPEHFNTIKEQQPVRLRVQNRDEVLTTAVAFVSPIVDEKTQSKFVRVYVPNPGNELFPGQFVVAEVETGTADVAVAVQSGAIQRIDERDVVFIAEGEAIEARPVRLGRSDGQFTEVLSGLKPGESYYAGDTFILKAEHEKGKAAHEH